MNHLSLFSGYEGFGLGLRLAGLDIRTVGYVEIDTYCQQLLQARIEDGHLDYAPIIRDIKAADFRPMAGLVDIITAGFPCQPHSVAGKREGADDERNLWPDTRRAVSEVGPAYVLLENVPGILANGYGGTVVGQLSELGYDCRWGIVSAARAGAPHLRKRWWCLAHNSGCGRGQTEQDLRIRGADSIRGSEFADADNPGRQELRAYGIPPEAAYPDAGSADTLAADVAGEQMGPAGQSRQGPAGNAWWATEPDVVRVVHGHPHRVDRIRTLGNGIVPAVVKEFLNLIGGKHGEYATVNTLET